MYEVMIEDVFSSAHHLRNYKGRCENVHGHNWKVQVMVAGEQIDECGLLLDFHLAKEKLKKVLSALDHKNLNCVRFFKRVNPTSENISFYIYGKMKDALKNYPVTVKCVTVWESDKQCASYYQTSAKEKIPLHGPARGSFNVGGERNLEKGSGKGIL